MPTVYATVHSLGVQTITNNTITKLTGLTLDEVEPTGAPSPWHNGNQRFEISTGRGGRYQINARGQWGSTFTGSGLLMVKVNDTTAVYLDQRESTSTPSGAINNGLAKIRLADGDYVEVFARQVSGSSRTFLLHEATIERVSD